MLEHDACCSSTSRRQASRALTAVDRDDAARLAIAVAADAYLAVQARGEWPRLKVCASPDCRWAFWDTTRNRSRRWCDMAGCGNRAKNRTWREPSEFCNQQNELSS